MKKLILFLLIGALLVLPLSGCFADNKQNEGTTPNNTTENTTPENTKPNYNPLPDETTPEATTPPEDDQKDPPAIVIPPEGNQNHPPVVEGEVDKNSDLIVELVTYWKELNMDIFIYPLSFSQKIHTIEQGKQPLHVAFDPDDYYFVCAYNSPDNENFSYDDCIWVRYEKETAIQETYNGGKLAKAFQINRSLSVTDILPSDKPVPDMEHFRPYDPVFENGINTAAPLFFNESFIYLNDSTDETIYYSMRQSTDSILVIPCVYFENQYYLSFRHYVIDSDGKQGEKGSYEGMFGDYCDVLSDKAVAEKYSVTNDGGFTWFYVLVPLEDFVNGVLK